MSPSGTAILDIEMTRFFKLASAIHQNVQEKYCEDQITIGDCGAFRLTCERQRN